jgi:GNAT superfamily N-acetyltransferase
MTTATQSRRYARLIRDFSLAESKAYNTHLLDGGTVEDFFDKMEKHGNHDQSSHGNWATGGMGAGVADSILSRVRENGGLSVNMVDGSEPTSGYMVAKGAKFGDIVDAVDFYDPVKGPKALAAYMKKHKKELGGGKNYLGLWHNTEDGKVYLDVSENIQDRERAISAGRKQDQISIWDVTNFAEIQTGGTGNVEKTGNSRTANEHFRYERFRDRGLRSEDLGEVSKTLKVIRFAPGLKPVIKHGEHDQSTHGNWANQGYTAEEEARISEMSSMGPALEDLDAILDSVNGAGSNPSMDDFKLIVENDRGMYEAATEGIDERVDAYMEAYPNANRDQIYEQEQEKMIDEYINDNSDDLHAEFAASRGGGEDTETLLSQAQAFFEDVYNYDYEYVAPDGDSGFFSSEVQQVEIYDHPYDGSQNSIRLTGEVTFDGEYAGEFARTFWKDENGKWNVEHELFRMQDEYQGTGFGKAFIQRQEDWYVAAGFNSIEVGTGWDGARHWARAGYDFNDRYIRPNMLGMVSALNVEVASGRGFELGSPERAEFDSLMRRASTDYTSDINGGDVSDIRPMTDPDFPIPNDFAMIGYDRRTSFEYEDAMGNTRTGYTWAGKTLLQDSNFKYKKVLTAEGRSINAGPIDRDGDGLVYDGTAREKPASAVSS